MPLFGWPKLCLEQLPVLFMYELDESYDPCHGFGQGSMGQGVNLGANLDGLVNEPGMRFLKFCKRLLQSHL
jgi:hypothetical protein